MEFKRLINQFTYRIEAKADGGFIAHATDPTLPPIEAPTRAELQAKIQANISAALSAEFPGLTLPLQKNGLQFAFHIEKKPDGGMVLHTNDGQERPIGGSGNLNLDNPILEKVMDMIGKHFMPQLAQALASQQGNKDVQVFVSRNTGYSSGKPVLTSGAGQLMPNAAIEAGFGRSQDALDPSSNATFTPESSGLWPFIRLLIAALIVGAMIYFFRHH